MDPRRSPAVPQTTETKKVTKVAGSKKKKKSSKHHNEEDGVDITDMYGVDAHNDVAFDMEIQRLKRLQEAKEALTEGEVLSGLAPSSGPTLTWKGANKEATEKAQLAAEMRKLAPDERPSYSTHQRYGKSSSSSDNEEEEGETGDGGVGARVGDYLKGVDSNDHDTDSSEDEVQQVKRKHTNKKKKLMASLKQKGDVPTDEDASSDDDEEEDESDEDETEEEEESTEEEEEDDDDDTSTSSDEDNNNNTAGHGGGVKQRYANVTEAEAAAADREAMRVSDLVASIYNGTGNSFGEVDWGPDEVESSSSSSSSGSEDGGKGKKQPSKKPKKY